MSEPIECLRRFRVTMRLFWETAAQDGFLWEGLASSATHAETLAAASVQRYEPRRVVSLSILDLDPVPEPQGDA